MKNERTNNCISEAIYETDGLVMEFAAKVVSCNENDDNTYGVILDRTAFFPEGGGQQRDEGTINNEKVLDIVKDDDGNIVHIIANEVTKGSMVIGRIDRDLRMSRMQNHGGEHILSGLIHNKFGYDNVGFHMSEKDVTFDVDGVLSQNELDQIEKEANEIVFKNVPISISFPTEEEARELSYRSKLDIYEGIRLVTIEGVDVCACCAPHLPSTGSIGVIKIINAMPHRQGTRITMIAGMNAYDDYVMLHNDNAKIMSLLSSKREDTADFTENLLGRNNALREELTQIKREMTALVSERVITNIKSRNPEDTSAEVIFTNSLDNVGLRELINACTKEYAGVVIGFIGNDSEGYRYIVGCSGSKNAGEIAKKLNEAFNGKGGGSKEMAQGSISGSKDVILEFTQSF